MLPAVPSIEELEASPSEGCESPCSRRGEPLRCGVGDAGGRGENVPSAVSSALKNRAFPRSSERAPEVLIGPGSAKDISLMSVRVERVVPTTDGVAVLCLRSSWMANLRLSASSESRAWGGDLSPSSENMLSGGF